MKRAVQGALGTCVLGVMVGCGGGSNSSTPPPPIVAERNSCTTTNTTSPAQPAPTSNFAGQPITLTVMAGTTPVVGAQLQLYAAGTTGNGSTPKALLSSLGTTDANGRFYVAGGFTCPLSNSVLYVVAKGGKAGSGGTTNGAIALASILGTCNSVVNGSSFTVNEATTVATAWAMSQFMAGEYLGATATNGAGIAAAAATVANLVNVTTGTMPGPGFPTTGTAPVAKMGSLANLLNGCTTSGSATSTACSQLFTLTGVATSSTVDTLGAAVQLAKTPGTNVAAIYTQSAMVGAYAPVLSAAPADWTLAATFGGGGMKEPTALSIDSTGKIWVVNYSDSLGNGVTTLLSNTGTPMYPAGIGNQNLYASYGGAVDVNDVMWVDSEQSYYAVNGGLGAVTQQSNAGSSPGMFSSGGMNFPLATAFDTSGNAWVVDYGNSHVTLLSGSGSPLSGTTGYTATNLEFPVAVATNALCNGYLANQATNTVTKVIANGSAFTDYTVDEGPSGLAVDASSNLWTANYYGNSVGFVSADGLTVVKGYTGGGLNHPQGIAVDGAGNVWVANYRGPALTELAGAGAAKPGAVLSPSAGWGTDAGLLEAYALAIDGSGNLWVTNLGANTVTEFVGLASPVKTPLLGPVRVP